MKLYCLALLAFALLSTSAIACSGPDIAGEESVERHCIYQIQIFEMERRAFTEDERAIVVANVTEMGGEVLSSSDERIKARARCGLVSWDISEGVFPILMSSSEMI